jgi:hypothetical protein
MHDTTGECKVAFIELSLHPGTQDDPQATWLQGSGYNREPTYLT